MKKIFAYLFVVIFLNAAYFANAQVLWQNTKYGMTVNEVKSLYPNSVTLNRPNLFIYSGAKGLLELNNIEIVSQMFKATFYFSANNNKLEQVTLECTDKITEHKGKLIYNSLLEVLISKYGNPITKGKNLVLISSATWLSGDTNISLNLLELNETTLNIVYQVRLAKEKNKL